MDTRIAAGVLDHLRETGEIRCDLIAITWGLAGTRDVEYARRVARSLGWEWVHLPLDAERLWANIEEAALRGCETTPVHLHGMALVRELPGIDLVAAASYGDSVGRAEYSRKHITQLRPFHHLTRNWFRLLKEEVYRASLSEIQSDIRRYREIFPRQPGYPRNEIDQQVHYLRRKLNPCFSIITSRKPLYQMFASPEMFGPVWALSPEVRGDGIYQHMLGRIHPSLSQIPWARTGRSYVSLGTPRDDLPPLFHAYGRWLRGPLYNRLKQLVLSPAIEGLGIFNMHSLEVALEVNRRVARQDGATKMDEVAAWIASLSIFVERHGIRGVQASSGLGDRLRPWLVTPFEVAGLQFARRLVN